MGSPVSIWLVRCRSRSAVVVRPRRGECRVTGVERVRCKSRLVNMDAGRSGPDGADRVRFSGCMCCEVLAVVEAEEDEEWTGVLAGLEGPSPFRLCGCGL